MEFKVERKLNENLYKYPTQDLHIAKQFSEELRKELGEFVMGVVVFGSSVRREATPKSDIDVLVLSNDASFTITEPLIEAYRLIVESLVTKISLKLHITSMTFTAFWEHVKASDPVVINIIRDGIALYDTGFFDPLQKLLHQGRIRPTEESVWRYFGRAPKTLLNSRWHILQATLDLYWSVIDAAHAALMQAHQVPTSPEHVADLLEKTYTKHKMLEPKYVEIMRNFYILSKKITHREVKIVTGAEYEHYYKDAESFVRRMKQIIEKGKF